MDMLGKMDARFFFIAVSGLCLLGAVISAGLSLVSGLVLPQGQMSFFGLNINIIYLFLFAGIMWAVQHLRNKIDRAEAGQHRKAAAKKPRGRKPKRR
jgi:hypothetical protein